MLCAPFPGQFRSASVFRTSVNGSEETGRAKVVDGFVPSLPSLENNTMWASELDTIRLEPSRNNPNSVDIVFDTTETSLEFNNVEIIMFNCPEWGIGPDSIILQQERTFGRISTVSDAVTSFPTSCDRLVRVCIPTLNTVRDPFALSLTFSVSSNSSTGSIMWVHVAEVIFNNQEDCPTDLRVSNEGEWHNITG